jgi:hypothetical protein
MRHAVWLQDGKEGWRAQASSAGKIALLFVPLTVLVASCGGSGDGSSPSSPILEVGMQRQYTGTTTRSVVYAVPTASLQNNTLIYTVVQTQTVQGSTDAPADFDVHADYAYTVVQDPGVGTVPTSESVDTYENLLISGDTQTVSTVGQKIVSVSNDETSNALVNGPYTETSTTTSEYQTPRDNFSYPLQTGATMTSPQSETQTIVFTDVNASGSAPSNGTNVGHTITRSENDDGSYAYQTAYVNGSSSSRTQNADGSGTQTSTNATTSSTTTVSLPATVNGVSSIPISVSVDSAKSTTTDYAAADWYPGGGAPSSPLVLETKKVIGPTSTLPSDCNGAVLRPNIYEIDTTTTNLNPIGASYSSTSTRNFSAADGASICQLSTETAWSYDLDTGGLVSTTTTTTTVVLSAINY